MTEKKVIDTQYGWYQKNDDKVNVDEIIGIVKTDEQTNSVQLKKEAQLSICEKRVLELEKENEELKKALVELKEIGDYQEGRIKELNDENEHLESELGNVVEVCRKYGRANRRK